MVIVCICGASGSGKTSLSKRIAAELKSNCISAYVLALDSYYICYPELEFEQRTLINYDAPDSINFQQLKEDIKLLKEGSPITTKMYDYSLHLRCDKEDLIYPPQVLILEGIHAFADKELLEQSDLRLYVDTDIDECIVRRMCRDVQKRERTVQAIADQYLTTVKPMFEKYIRFYRNDADACIVGGGHNKRSVKLASLYIMSLIEKH